MFWSMPENFMKTARKIRKKRQHFKRYGKNAIFEKTIIVIISRT